MRAHSGAKNGAIRRDPTEFNRQLNELAKGKVVMDYEMMKALMEANREQLAVPRKLELKEFPKRDSRPVWKYLDYVRKERIAA